MSWSTILQLIAVLVIFYFYIKQKYSYWKKRGINGPLPIFPFGYLLERAMNEPPDFEYRMAQKYGKVYGIYSGLLPTLTVNDATMIKQILVKDFPQFLNRRSLNSFHHLWNDNLFNAESDTWKRIRTITSRTFSTGKLRGMYPNMNRCVDKLINYLDKVTGTGQGVVDTKTVITGFTVDVIASTSFATETDTNGDRANQKNDHLLLNCMKIFEFNGFRIAAVYALPRMVLNWLGIYTWFDQGSFKYFIELTRRILKQRETEQGSNIKRNDFVQLMVDSYVYDDDLNSTDYDKLTATNSNDQEEKPVNSEKSDFQARKQTLSENEIIAQSILFFAAGFETTSATISNSLYELARHPQVQEKLFEELEENLHEFHQEEEQNSRKYFDLVNQLPYLDSVIKETLRRYPAAIRIERRLSGEDKYMLGELVLEKGTLIEISTYAVHHDAQYHPEPFNFRPERFMPENKHLIVPYTYIPFGAGPRNCVGLRFAYQEVKLCLAKIIRRYRFSTTPHTPEKLSFKPGSLLLNVAPFPLKVSRR